MLRALRSRNYRLFFAGQLVSLIGNWMTVVTNSWLVYEMTGSEFWLGVSAFVSQFPTFIFAPFAGVFVDRWRLRRLLVATQAVAMIQSFALASLAITGHLNLTYLILLNLIQGFVKSFDMPARQAFVVQMLDDRRDLPGAIALNSLMINGARMIGPAIAGVLLATVGAATCYFVDGFSYIAVILALLAMRVTLPALRKNHPPVLESVKEGFRVSFGFAPIRTVLLLLMLVSLAGVPYMVLMPIFAKDILHGGPRLLGLLTCAVGLGALVGGLYLANRKSVVGISRALTFAAAMFGVAISVFGLSTNVYLSLAVLPIGGMCMIIQMAGSNTLLQTLAEDHQRGRVMAMFGMCFMGTVPIGSLLCGLLANRIGAPLTLVCGGVTCIIGAALFWRQRPKIRDQVYEIYQRRGILPAVAQGMRNASAATSRV